MPATWTPAFDFYMGTSDGVPFLRSIDLAAIEHVPLESHSVWLSVRVTMRFPREDGLRSEEESDALYEVDEWLGRALAEEYDAIYWGKSISGGFTIFDYQLPAGRELEGFGRPVDGVTADYDLASASRDDPEWRGYRASYPNAYQQQQMQNRQAQYQLEQQGDRLAKRRKIDHVALFPSREAMDAAIVALKKAKFRIGDRGALGSTEEGEGYGVEFSRRDACNGMRPNDVTAEILDCIEPHGGSYDGWGCAVTR